MQRLLFLTALLTSLSFLALACSGGSDGGDDGSGIAPIPANTELVVGPNRFAMGLIDEDNTPILDDPDTSVRLAFYYEDKLEFATNATFTWAIPDVNGFWTANIEFDSAGEWKGEAFVTRAEESELVRFAFDVLEEGLVPNVGDAALPSENLTLTSEPNLKRLTTDQDPEASLYELTIAQAIEAQRPFVLVFATPAFCQTRFCGPVVDNVKEAWQAFGERANFIHIEPFELDADGQQVVGDQGVVAAAPTLEWNLPTEPWIFIVDANGVIASRFEGTASVSEITAALESVLI